MTQELVSRRRQVGRVAAPALQLQRGTERAGSTPYPANGVGRRDPVRWGPGRWGLGRDRCTVIQFPYAPTRHALADKNAHRAEEAAERFKEIQNAYEILSDKHERAWCVGGAPGAGREPPSVLCACVCAPLGWWCTWRAFVAWVCGAVCVGAVCGRCVWGDVWAVCRACKPHAIETQSL